MKVTLSTTRMKGSGQLSTDTWTNLNRCGRLTMMLAESASPYRLQSRREVDVGPALVSTGITNDPRRHATRPFEKLVRWVVIIDFTLANIGVTLYEGLNFFGLLAMPLFVLTGDLINASGIARRLTAFAYKSVGWLHGGLAMAALGACGMFAAISGSNAATTATIGSIMHPEMVRGKYDPAFSAATVAAGGTVGIIIPPSILFIVYGFLMNLSISDLFVAGLIPGVLDGRCHAAYLLDTLKEKQMGRDHLLQTPRGGARRSWRLPGFYRHIYHPLRHLHRQIFSH
jgi:hypothetical protein